MSERPRSPSRVVTASGDHTSRVWNADSGDVLAKLEGHSDQVNDAAFSPDGAMLATGNLAGSVKLWNAANGREIASLEGHTDLVFAVHFSRGQPAGF